MKLKHLFYTGILWEHLYFIITMKGWLRFKDKILLEKRYQPLILSRYGIKLNPKHRHRRSMRYINMMLMLGDRDSYKFAREGKPIGRKKHNKWLYMPKRVRLE